MVNKKFGFDYEAIKEKMKKEEESKASFGDPRFWKLKLNDCKGQAVIRFLPDPNGTPYKQYFQHWFDYESASGGVQKYIENCATSIKMGCPVCDKNRELWNSAYKQDKDTASLRKRKAHWVSNILVLQDESNPVNEGKVFLFDYGPQVYGFVKKAIYGPEEGDPEYDSEVVPVTYMPCDFYDGADFLYRSTVKKGTENLKRKWNTYESSKFRPQSQILNNLDDVEWEEKMQSIMDQVHDLSEWTNSDKYPDENKVRSKLSYILGAYDSDPENINGDKKPDIEADPEPGEPDPDPLLNAAEQMVETITEGDSSDSQTDEEYLNNLI
jgi:hypothetical protein